MGLPNLIWACLGYFRFRFTTIHYSNGQIILTGGMAGMPLDLQWIALCSWQKSALLKEIRTRAIRFQRSFCRVSILGSMMGLDDNPLATGNGIGYTEPHLKENDL